MDAPLDTPHDYEKGGKAGGIYTPDAERAPDAVLVGRFGRLGQRVLGPLFAAGVEARGVERVPEDERSTKNIWNNLLMWFVRVHALFCARER
jgi:hypothetical protein